MRTSRSTLLARLLAGALPGLAALALPALATAGPAADLEAGRRTFESVCAACHGPTGHPDPENPTTAAVPFEDQGGDSMQWTVIPQLRFGLTRGAHVALNLGAEFPLSDQPYDTRWHLTLLWDFADGSFFKGWR